MFTGLTLGLGAITGRRPKGDGVDLIIEPNFNWGSPLVLGESIAVSGVCLTVTAVSGAKNFTAFASAETLSLTGLNTAAKVNLERALKVGDRLGGHLVSGHIDSQGKIISVKPAGASVVYQFEAPKEMAPLLVPKGSVAIDGVSLTINESQGGLFSVNLIPHSAALTTLGIKKAGDPVNLEADIIGKYVHSFLAKDKPQSVLTKDILAANGFL